MMMDRADDEGAVFMVADSYLCGRRTSGEEKGLGL